MAKNKYKEIVEKLIGEFIQENGYELYNVEFVKEAKDWFLRVYIDKLQNENEETSYISTDDCEKVSRYLSEKMDEEDPIQQNYYLEVSSPGMDRELITEEHYRRYIGSAVELKLYKAIDNKKNLQGILVDLNDDTLWLKDEKDSTISIPREQIAKAKLAVIF